MGDGILSNFMWQNATNVYYNNKKTPRKIQ